MAHTTNGDGCQIFIEEDLPRLAISRYICKYLKQIITYNER